MQAVIVMSEEPRGLNPINIPAPRPLLRLCGQTLIGNTLLMIKKAGITKCTVALSYSNEELAYWIGRNTPKGLRVNCVFSDTEYIMPTIKSATYSCKEKTLVVDAGTFYGDGFSRLISSHERSKADITVGVIKESGRSHRLLEKKTGLYVLSESVAALFEGAKRLVTFENFISKALESGLTVHQHSYNGYCNRLSGVEDYMRCCFDIAEGIAGVEVKSCPPVLKSGLPEREVVFLGGVKLGDGVTFNGRCVIGGEVTLEKNCVISQAVIGDGCMIGEGATVSGAVVSGGAVIKSGAVLLEGSVVGEGAVVGSGSVLEQGVRVWPLIKVGGGRVVLENQMGDTVCRCVFNGCEISGMDNGSITPEMLVRLGCAIGSVLNGAPVAVGSGESRVARALKLAFISGALSSGAYVTDFGEPYRSLFDFAVTYTAAEFGLYIDSVGAEPPSKECTIFLNGKAALPPGGELLLKIERILSDSLFLRAEPQCYGERISLDGMQVLYASELLRYAPFGLSGMKARAVSGAPQIRRLLNETLDGLMCDTSEGMQLHILNSGKGLSITCEDGRQLPQERVFALVAESKFLSGEDIAVDYMAPSIIDTMAKRHGRRVLRYSGHCRESEEEALSLAARQNELRDGLMMSLYLLSFLKTNKIELNELLKNVPLFFVHSGSAEAKGGWDNLVAGFKRAGGEAFGQTAVLKTEKGEIKARNNRSSGVVNIWAEYENAEISRELCAEAMKLVRGFDRVILDNIKNKG